MVRKIGGVVAFLSWLGCSSKVDYGYKPLRVDHISHAGFDALLKKYVDSKGRVAYGTWKAAVADVAALDEYLNLVANASPRSRGDLFPLRRDALTYWINAYNALVIRAVLEHWPIRSVTDVKGGVNFVRGQGFFANRKYLIGGEWISLYDLENRYIRNEQDPRVHFALNCASGSCPVLPSTAFRPEDLEQKLDAAAREFINAERNVLVSQDRKTVYLSKIFEWYEEDFLKALNRPGGTVLDYLLLFAEPSLGERIRTAQTGKYSIQYLEYDWSINSP